MQLVRASFLLVETEAVGYQKGGSWLGTFLLIVLVILLLLALLGAGGYSVRRYWSPAGSEVVETSDSGYGAGAGSSRGGAWRASGPGCETRQQLRRR